MLHLFRNEDEIEEASENEQDETNENLDDPVEDEEAGSQHVFPSILSIIQFEDGYVSCSERGTRTE